MHTVLMKHPRYPPKEVPEDSVKKFEANGWIVSGIQVKKRGRPAKEPE